MLFRSCARGGSDRWYFGGGTTVLGANLTLWLFNPFPGDAVVDLSFSTDTGNEGGEFVVGRRFGERESAFRGESPMLTRHVVVTDDHVRSPIVQRLGDCSTRDAEPPHQRRGSGHRIRACWVKSAMKMATAVATQIPEMIQKRMMTVVSGQPLSSKW